ncbi:MAG TPA: zinc ribbon domain-containing protein [Casimicrobiaceae bacterium]|nr:zinc ribbon domain-containing protein [Casimicrobiaceae bacterium]
MRLGYWPALAFYTALIWLELFVLPKPVTLGIALVGYTALTLIGARVFGERAWFRHAEMFSVLLRLVGLLAPIEYAIAADEKTVQLRARAPLSAVIGSRPEHVSLVVFVLFMLSSTTFDGLHETLAWMNVYWKWLLALAKPLWHFDLIASQRTLEHWYVAFQHAALVLSPFVYFSVYVAVQFAVKAAARSAIGVRELALAFALTVLPIGLVYNMAHYWTVLLIQLPRLPYLLADPLGRGWIVPFIGTPPAERPPLDMASVWNTEVTLIVVGHLVGVYLSHRIALRVAPRGAREPGSDARSDGGVHGGRPLGDIAAARARTMIQRGGTPAARPSLNRLALQPLRHGPKMPGTSCRFCSSRNPAAAKFCNECGSPLDLKPCPHCDAINHLAVDTCHQCGAALPTDSAPDVARGEHDATQAPSANSSDAVADTPMEAAPTSGKMSTSDKIPTSEAPSSEPVDAPSSPVSLDSIPIALSNRFDDTPLRSPEPSAARLARRREPTLEAASTLASALAPSMATTVPERLQASVLTPAIAFGSNAGATPAQAATPSEARAPAPARAPVIAHTKAEQISPATLAASADDRSIARWRTLGVIPDTPAEARRRRSVSYAAAAIGVALCVAGVGAYYASQGAHMSDAMDVARAVPSRVQQWFAAITTPASMQDSKAAQDATPSSTPDTSRNAATSGASTDTATPPPAAEASQPPASSDTTTAPSNAQTTPGDANQAPESAAPAQAEDDQESAHREASTKTPAQPSSESEASASTRAPSTEAKVPPVASTQRATTSSRSSTRAKHRTTTRAAVTRPIAPPPNVDKDAAATQRLIEHDLAGFLPPSRSTDRPSQ